MIIPKIDYYPPMLAGQFYHIYNRGNNHENLFYSHENYRYFLEKWQQYLTDYVDTYAYCLLPNHFHFLIHVKDFKDYSPASLSGKFRSLFPNYAEKIDKEEGRQGSLFQKNFRRKIVVTDRYLTELVYYIHANPQKHGFCSDFKTYSYSSYLKILEQTKTSLQKEYVLKWFGRRQEYLKCHHQYEPTQGWPNWILD
ncbi:transposase [Siphonobacter sp. SORGH_AS_0500]|uniref:transposase n=1 Tax=Siphonobacter sp. SORGH_AS_0500 TaxID=1864824 RepID=UPI0028600B52|nr:transposase [Siphonobacter sp. SORGH_AS_0500]MDR6196330.1 putative transposase [Siphonobacter sp. SORGH_AS_0500]